jgi:imidazoleglycerol-phosphate dehydratase
MNKLGISITKLSPQQVVLQRTTLESKIKLSLEARAKRKYDISTGNAFFNHMLACLATRACLNLDAVYIPTDVEPLDHMIVEDTGLTLGRAVRELIEQKRSVGVSERGTYTVAFDEALVTVSLAFDGRAYTFFHGQPRGAQLEQVEDILSTSLRQFFDGFSQGAGCVTHVQLLAGEDAHHTWEAAFKAFGEALREALEPCSYRANTTIGLKGTGVEK